MHRQGYLNKSNKFLYDNQSAMRMEVNGRNAYTGNSRHIYIRYLFIMDLLEIEELSMVYCPTHIMLADYFRNPLQRLLSHKFRDIFMRGAIPFKILEYMFSYTSKGPVGKQIPSKDIPSGTG